MKSIDSFAEYNSRLRRFIPRCKADEEPFNQLALALFALQFASVEPYRRFCDGRRVAPDKITHWTEIPAVPAAAFKELECSSLPAGQRATAFHSSGTTEQRPSRHFHSAESLAIYEASLLPWFKTHLLPDTDKFAFLILAPSPARAPHSSLAHMFETARRAFGSSDSLFVGILTGLATARCDHEPQLPLTRPSGTLSPARSDGERRARKEAEGAWRLDFAATLSALRRAVESNQPLALLGTAFSFVHLLDHLEANDLQFSLPAGSRAMETGGYKGRSRSLPKAELHALITGRLGLPASHIVCEYGMSELSSQAYDWTVRSAECGARSEPRAFHFPPWARARIISPETGREIVEGETGLIQVYDLANVRSVMAIQTEDLGVRRGGGFALIGRAALAEPRGCSLLTG